MEHTYATDKNNHSMTGVKGRIVLDYLFYRFRFFFDAAVVFALLPMDLRVPVREITLSDSSSRLLREDEEGPMFESSRPGSPSRETTLRRVALYVLSRSSVFPFRSSSGSVKSDDSLPSAAARPLARIGSTDMEGACDWLWLRERLECGVGKLELTISVYLWCQVQLA